MSYASSMNVSLRLLGAFLLLFLPACSERGETLPSSESTTGSEEFSGDAPGARASFAMAYEPSSDEEAIGLAQNTVRTHPEDTQAYLGLTEAFLVRKRETADARYFALAKDALAAARSLAGDSEAVRTTSVQLLFSDHRFQEAAAETRKIIAANPGNATAHLLLSDALVEEGDYEGAVLALEDAMDILPDLRVYARGSYMRWLDGDLEGAIELMHDAIERGSTTSEAVAWCLVELGMMHWHAGALDEASKAAERALSLVDGYPPAIELSARIASSRGDRLKAIALYQELLSQRSTVAAHIALSELLASEGRSDEALTQRSRAASLAVHDPLALAVHDARHSLNPPEALALAARAEAERSNIYTRDAHALALFRAGQIEEARKRSGDAIGFGKLDATLWLHRGLIQAAAGDTSAAQESLKSALALNPLADPLVVAELRATLSKEHTP